MSSYEEMINETRDHLNKLNVNLVALLDKDYHCPQFKTFHAASVANAIIKFHIMTDRKEANLMTVLGLLTWLKKVETE